MSLNESYAPTGESSSDLYLETTMVVGPLLGAIAYGALIAVYILCLSTFFGTRAGKSNRPFNLFYTTLSFICATIGNAANLHGIPLTYINNRNYPDGPVAFQIYYYTLPIQIAGLTFFTFGTFMQDAYLLYRFLVFWNYNLWLAVLPVLSFLGVVATGIGFLYYSLRPGASIIAPMSVQFGTAFFSISVGLNLLLTLMIIGRLVYIRSFIKSGLGQTSKIYTSIISMLIESSAIYSSFALVFIITYAIGNPFQNIVLPPLGVLQSIAPLLIIYRVARGQAYNADSSQESRTLPSMNFAPRQDTTRKHEMRLSGRPAPSRAKSYPNATSTDTDSRVDGSVSSRIDLSSTEEVHRQA